MGRIEEVRSSAPANLRASPERSPTDRAGASEGRIPNCLATCTPRAYSAAQSFRRRDDPPQETALTTVIITGKRMGLLMAWTVPRSAEQRSAHQIRRVARQGDPAEGLRDWASLPAAPLGLAASGSVPVGSCLSEDRAVIDILGQFSLVSSTKPCVPCRHLASAQSRTSSRRVSFARLPIAESDSSL